MSTERPLRLGVIGAGWFASRRHLPDACADPRVELAALCRRDEQLLLTMGQHFDVSALYTDYDCMLTECELDAVLIATPHNLHYQPAVRALEAGLHVLVEKPLTLTVHEGRELVSLAAAKGLVLSVALNPPYWQHCHVLREKVATIGPLETVQFVDTSNARGVFGREPLPENLPGVVPPTMFRAEVEANGGGNLVDGGSHLISELLWCTGEQAVEVSCRMDDCPADMRSLTTVRLANGALCAISVLADSDHPGKRVHHVYFGSRGSVYASGWPFTIECRGVGGESTATSEAEMDDVPTPVGDFANAILTGETPLSTGKHALSVVSVISAAYESARQGCPVEPEAVD